MAATVVINDVEFIPKNMTKNSKILIVGSCKTGKTNLAKELIEELLNRPGRVSEAFVSSKNNKYEYIGVISKDYYYKDEQINFDNFKGNEQSLNDKIVVLDEVKNIRYDNAYLKQKNLTLIHIEQYCGIIDYSECEGRYDYVFVLGGSKIIEEIVYPKSILEHEQIKPIYAESLMTSYRSFMWENVGEYPVYKKFMFYKPKYEPKKDTNGMCYKCSQLFTYSLYKKCNEQNKYCIDCLTIVNKKDEKKEESDNDYEKVDKPYIEQITREHTHMKGRIQEFYQENFKLKKALKETRLAWVEAHKKLKEENVEYKKEKEKYKTAYDNDNEKLFYKCEENKKLKKELEEYQDKLEKLTKENKEINDRVYKSEELIEHFQKVCNHYYVRTNNRQNI